MSSILIRRATPADASEINAYVRRIIDEQHNNVTRDPGQWDKTDEQEREFLEKIETDPKQYFIVAVLGGRIVGVANIFRHPQTTQEHAASLGLSVAVEYRRQGIGRALMDALLAWAKEHKLRRVELKVFTRNTPAIALYRDLGFVQEGLHRMAALKQGVWCDDLTMALILRPAER